MFSEAAPDGDWALADDQMPERQIAAKVIRREKTILLPLQVQAVYFSWSDRRSILAANGQPFWLYLKDQNRKAAAIIAPPARSGPRAG